MRLGVTRQGPSAPLACQFGKYDTLTKTGVPTLDTWKLTVVLVVETSVTRVVDTCRTGGRVSPTVVRGHEAGPPCASSTFQRFGWSYQVSDWLSQPDGAGSTPDRTA